MAENVLNFCNKAGRSNEDKAELKKLSYIANRVRGVCLACCRDITLITNVTMRKQTRSNNHKSKSQ